MSKLLEENQRLRAALQGMVDYCDKEFAGDELGDSPEQTEARQVLALPLSAPDYSWIKVKRWVDDSTKTWEERFRALEAHHEAETKFLIAEIERLRPKAAKPGCPDAGYAAACRFEGPSGYCACGAAPEDPSQAVVEKFPVQRTCNIEDGVTENCRGCGELKREHIGYRALVAPARREPYPRNSFGGCLCPGCLMGTTCKNRVW